MSPTPDLVKVYRKSTGEKLQHRMHRDDVRRNPDLAIVPSHRDRTRSTYPIPDFDAPVYVEAVEAARAAVAAEGSPESSADPVEQTQTNDDPRPGSEHEKE